MVLHIPFDNSYARLSDSFYARLNPKPVTSPRLVRFNTELADELGLIPGSPEEQAQVFSGNHVPEGAEPLAQVYAGHQFGGFSPQLGDGRANLLGEVTDRNGVRRDIQLKGSGPTPWSRNGDGRAWLGPVLREYVVSEAMHALGIPTSRALAAVESGERVLRETGALPGAILTRVANSHIRVGTFQFFAARRNTEALKELYDHAAARHYPEANTPGAFLRAVTEAQADLIARWMSVGFIHGVMNTDNTTISGETIDYGPCAFMDVFHPDTTFSSIDLHGRYAYDNQAKIIVWNMAQLATALVPLMPDTETAIEEFTEIVHAMPDQIHRRWLTHFGRKIGLQDAALEDEAMIIEFERIMALGRADFTNAFRALITGKARDQFVDPTAFDAWEGPWRKRLEREGDPMGVMRAANPAFIPRNHRVEEMIAAAVEGDYAPFERLLEVLSDPYTDQPEHAELRRSPEPSEVVQQTFCGT